MLTPLFSNLNEVGEIYEVTGTVTIKPTQTNLLPSVAISGRVLHYGDIIHSSDDGEIQFILMGDNNHITMSGISELQVEFEKSTFHLKLNYGNIFTETSSSIISNCLVITHSSRIILDEGELWITRSIADKDEVHVIDGSANITSIGGLEQRIEMGEMLIINGKGEMEINKITKDMLPAHIFQRLETNQQYETEELPFTVMNYFTDDSTIIQVFHEEKNVRPFNFSLGAGAVTIEESQYTKVSLIPMYTSDRIKFGYNLTGFIGLSDNVKNLNTYSTLSHILAPLSFYYQSSNGNYHLKLGKISNLTFGYGMLLKQYTNTISYPLKQDGGLVFDFQSDAENYTFKFFTSSLGELANGGGLSGVHGTAVIGLIKSLRFGAGIVYDLNQFSSVPESMWSGGVPVRKRSISGYQVDFTYEMKSGLRNDTYLFGEFTALTYPANLRYIRTEPVNGDTTEEGFERKSSFGILGPGIHWRLGHHRDIKIAFNYSSSLHTTPFFGGTYSLEKVHYVSASSLDIIEATEPYSQDEKWDTMIKENHIDPDSTAYYLPKDVYALLDPTRNVYNKMGISAEYSYHFRNYYQYSFDISIFQETEAVEKNNTYYTLGINFAINDGLIKGVSEFRVYFNQYFTSELFNTSAYNENMVFGITLGVKLVQNVSLRMYRHDVFYDRNLDGDVDLNSTMGVGLRAKF